MKNPAARDVSVKLRFPLPSTSSIYDDLSVNLNGENVGNRLRMDGGYLVLVQGMSRGESLTYEVAFQSRGLSYWYFQVMEHREIRDFLLTLQLPDIPTDEVNYPEGCMTPTKMESTPNGKGSVLTFRLDRAITNKGMGIALPTLSQPGMEASAVLDQVEKAWLLLFSALVLGLSLAGLGHSPLMAVLMGAIAACGYGLWGDLGDTFLGYWGAAGVVLLPVLLLLGSIAVRVVPGLEGKLLAAAIAYFYVLYPLVSGMDEPRRMMYLNLSAFLLLILVACQLAYRLKTTEPSTQSAATPRE